MKKVGEYIYLRGHGCGQINNIEEKEMGGDNITFYVVRLPSGMQVLSPINSPTIRDLTNRDDFYEMIKNLNQKVENPNNETWNRRHRVYMEQIKSLVPNDIAYVVRELNSLKET